jgi:ariadne-1
MICFETYRRKDMLEASCHHPFCRECYKCYISEAISNGPAVLDLRCAIPDCKACVRPYARQLPHHLAMAPRRCRARNLL